MVNFRLTLISYFIVLAFIFAVVADANHLQHHARMIKKRQTSIAAAPSGPVVNAAAGPSQPAAAAPSQDPATGKKGTGAGGAGNQQGTPAAAPANSAPTNAAPPPTNNNQPADEEPVDSNPFNFPTDDPFGIGSLTNLLPFPTAAGNTGSSSAASSSSASSATPSASSPLAPVNTPAPAQNQASQVGPVIVTSIDSLIAQPSNAANVSDTSGAAATGNSKHLARNTIIGIAAVGASIGVAVLIWTIIRKTKLGPSDQFEDRLNPIDWNPSVDNANGGSPDMVQRRRASIGSNRSFGSADAQSTRQAYLPPHMNGGGMISDLPNHDFTAGPTRSLAPVGTYADLRRGPSPGPMDHQLMRSGSGRSGYSNNAYGGVQYGGY